MPHAGIPRAMKRDRARGYDSMAAISDPANSPKVRALIDGNVIRLGADRRFNGRKNWLPRMDQQEIAEVRSIYQVRFAAAQPITEAVADKMDAWEMQYHGQWQDSVHDDEQHIFLNKTQEQVQTVGAFLHGLVLQIPQLVQFTPTPRTLVGFKDAWRKAKLKEALQSYYFDDVWKVRHTLVPDYIKTFLKFTTGIVKVDYFEDPNGPDLRFAVKDRALQYIDPYARRMREAKWWIEREFWSREAVEDMFKLGHWYRSYDFPDMAPSALLSSESSSALRRMYGENFDQSVPLPEDELVTVDHHYSAPTATRGAIYGVQVGGENGWLVRYGPNPFAYQGIPFRGASYDPHEWHIDGTGLVSMHTALQEIMNTALNLRLDDWRNNLWEPVLMPESLITSTTLQDWEDRQKIVRVNDSVLQLLMNNKLSLKDLMGQLPINSQGSLQLFQDLSFFLSQNDRIGHTSDVMRGEAPSKVMTANETQEMVSRSQGAFRPSFMSIMHTMEEIAEISQAYFADPNFYGEERIIIATGGRYKDLINDWQFEEGNVRAHSIRFDEMDVDVTVSATNAADALLSRNFKGAMLRDLLQAIGSVEGMYQDVRDDIDFKPMVLDYIRTITEDVDAYERPPEVADARKKERAQAQQNQIAMQGQAEAAVAQAKEGARLMRTVKAAQAEAQIEVQKEQALLGPQTQAAIAEIVARISADHKAQMETLLTEHAMKMREMILGQQLAEKTAAEEPGAKENVNYSGRSGA